MLGRAALQVAVQASIQLPALQRLTDELVHPGVEATLAVLGQHMGGHRDEGTACSCCSASSSRIWRLASKPSSSGISQSIRIS